MLGLTVKGPIVNEGTSETDDQRAVRLAQLSHNQQQRLSTESIDGVENQKLLKNVVLGLTVKRPIVNKENLLKLMTREQSD